FFANFFRIQGDRRGNNNDAGPLPLRWVQPEIADAASDDETNVTFAQIVLPDGFQECFRHLAAADRDFQADRARGIPEPFQMFFQPENAPVVKTDAFKDSVPV